MKLSVVLAASALAFGLIAAAPVASAAVEEFYVTTPNGYDLSFDINTSDPMPTTWYGSTDPTKPNGTQSPGGVLFAVFNAKVNGVTSYDIWSVYFYNSGSGSNDSFFGGYGVGAASPYGFFQSLPYEDNPYTTGVGSDKVATINAPTTGPVTISAAPEPATWMLMFAGVACAGAALRFARRNPVAPLA